MAEPKAIWFGEIDQAPFLMDIPEELRKSGVCLLTNSKRDECFELGMEIIEDEFEESRDFDNFATVPGIKCQKITGNNRQHYAWLFFDTKPPELDPNVKTLLCDLIVDQSMANHIVRLMSLSPWMLKSLTTEYKVKI